VPASFFTVTPCRLADTRQAVGASGGPALQQGAVRTLTVSGLRCGVPAGALAVAVNATAVGAAAGGHLTLFPAGQAVPPTSTVNFGAGQVRANNAVVPVGTNGEVAALAASAVHLVLDVTGYFAPP
jgi:hypothetical protein